MAEPMNLVQKLEKIQEMVEVIKKNKSNFKGKYVSEDELLARVAAGKKRYKVFLKQQIVPDSAEVTHIHYQKPKVLKSGDVIQEEVSQMLVRGELIYTWIDCENPSDTMMVPWFFVGVQDDPAQAFGSALTYANRYFQLKFFQIATPEDDPDNWRGRKEEAETEAEAAAEAAVTKTIVTKIDAHINAYLDLHQNSDEARSAMTKLVKKYVRNENGKPSANYNSYLTDKEIAATLYDELQQDYPLKIEEKADQPAPKTAKKKKEGNA